MAINSVELVSLLEKINLATINNPKVLQNAAKAIELISNSSNPSIRQKALIFQEKLKENPTFIELNKKEETKQAEIQQERSERLQEQLQAKRAVSASNKIEKDKKEELRQEKIKEQEFKTLLASSNWNSLPLWQQLEVLDYVCENFEKLNVQEKTQVFTNIANGYPNNSEEKQKKNEEVMEIANKPARNAYGPPPDYNEIAKYHQQNTLESETARLQANLTTDSHREHKTEQSRKDIQINLLAVAKERLDARFPTRNIIPEYDENGKVTLTEIDKNGVKHDVTANEEFQPFARDLENNLKNPVLNNDEFYTKAQSSKQQAKEQLNHIELSNNQDVFLTLNQVYEQSNQRIQILKQQGAFLVNDDHTIELNMKDLFFSDVIKSNPDTTMGFHIMVKDFIRGIYKDSNERSLDSYAIFAHCPFVEKMLKQGKDGEIMLKSIMENQWWGEAHSEKLIADMKKVMQEPDFAEKVAQAKQNIVPIAEFRERYAQEKLQDSLIAYFKNEEQFKEAYKNFHKKYPEYADERNYDHLTGMTNKELIAFIEKESGVKIEPEKLIPYLKDRGLTNETDIDKVLDNNELGKETKQENIVANEESKENQNDKFLSKFQTKEQIEQTISDNSKKLGYETINPSKPNNEENEQVNTIQYQQQSSISSNT